MRTPNHSSGPQPIWTATAEDILAKVVRGRVALEGVSQFGDTTLDHAPSPGVHCPRQLWLVAVIGEPDDLGGFRGLAARVSRGRTGIVLQPGNAADGSGFGVAVPTGDEQVPGRGVLVARGACTAIQVALPGP